jgi:hypothetical protein
MEQSAQAGQELLLAAKERVKHHVKPYGLISAKYSRQLAAQGRLPGSNVPHNYAQAALQGDGNLQSAEGRTVLF